MTIGKVFYLARDFARILRGKDYFHQPQPIGLHFADPRGYYNDLRGKAHWTGKIGEERVPILFLPERKAYVYFPIMIVQYGLGSLDCYFSSGDTRYLTQAVGATRWVLHNLNTDGYLDNLFPELEPGHYHHSANSGMCQGEALSLLTRLHREAVATPNLLAGVSATQVEQAIRSIYANMIRSLDHNGTAIKRGESLVFCEVCRKDDYVVLNGWIYALFGVLDYWSWSKEDEARQIFDGSVNLLAQELFTYAMPGGWSYYDNRRRICSPFYHKLHVDLLEALCRLTEESSLCEMGRRFAQAYHLGNRCRFTLRKAVEKLFDRVVYTTED